ncbi:MAG: hypothetical protein EDM05_55985 (plasmid) [Leptolyngbya sp. IPPAS B-1204]
MAIEICAKGPAARQEMRLRAGGTQKKSQQPAPRPLVVKSSEWRLPAP